MSKTSIWRRMHASLAVLTFLLVVAAGLAWWVEHNRAVSTARADLLKNQAANVRLQLTYMSDALRGLLLDPQNDLEKKRSKDAETELKNALRDIARDFKHHTELLLTI